MSFMNKKSLLKLTPVFFFVLNSCQTTGDLRKGRNAYHDPVVTEESGPTSQSVGIDELERELAVTRGKLSESEELHRRESAALEERIQILEKQNNDLLAQIAQLQNQSSTPKPVEAGDSKQQDNSLGLLWNQAIKELNKGNFPAAEQLFAEITKAPKGSKNFYAHIGVAFSQYSAGNFKESAITFNDILDKFPKHKRIALAWFGQGASFDLMGQSKDSKLFYTEAARSAPLSKEGKLAALILAKKAKAPNDLFAAFPNWVAP
jgi:TolA-binding protein